MTAAEALARDRAAIQEAPPGERADMLRAALPGWGAAIASGALGRTATTRLAELDAEDAGLPVPEALALLAAGEAKVVDVLAPADAHERNGTSHVEDLARAVREAVERVRAAPPDQVAGVLAQAASDLAGTRGVEAEDALARLVGAAMGAEMPEAEAVDVARRAWEAGAPAGRRVSSPVACRTGGRAAARWVPLPLAALPRELRDLAEHGAHAVGCDPSFLALPGLAVLGAAIGTTALAEVKQGWTEPPVLWVAVVGRSGMARKTPPLDHATDPLAAREWRHYAEWQRRMKDYAREHARWKALPPKRRADVDEPVPPVRLRAVVEDATIEALVRALAGSPRGVLLVRDELAGWLRSFDLYRDGGKGADVPRWLSIHRAGSVIVDRVSREALCADHAFVGVAGTIQPQTLRDCLTPALVEAGLAARIWVTFPPEALRRWTDATVPEDVTRAWDALVCRLLDLPRVVDGEGATVPRRVPLDPEARRMFAAWVNELGERAAEVGDAAAAALAKVEGGAARIALILRLAADPQAATIDARTMGRALALARWLAQEQERVYAILGGARPREHDGLLAWVLRKGGRASVREVTRGGPKRYRASAAVAEAGLAALVADGAGRWEDVPAPETGRPPGRVFAACDSATGDETPQVESTAEVDCMGPTGNGAPGLPSHVALSQGVETRGTGPEMPCPGCGTSKVPKWLAQSGRWSCSTCARWLDGPPPEGRRPREATEALPLDGGPQP